MSWYEFVIEFFEVVSWPVVTVSITYFLFKNFREPITQYLLYSPKKVTFPGGATIESGPLSQELEKPKVGAEGQLIEVIEDYRTAAVRWYKSWFFERMWNPIYKSQIEILEHLSKTKEKQDTWNLLFRFYAEAAKKYPSLLDYNYSNYVNFLINANFVAHQYDKANPMNSIIKITTLGEEFLEYLKSQGHSKEYKVF